jgi:hypothetical protein
LAIQRLINADVVNNFEINKKSRLMTKKERHSKLVLQGDID